MEEDNLGEYLVRQAWNMRAGESVKICLTTFRKAFPDSDVGRLLDGRSPEDRFLEKLPGVNYGQYKLTQNPMTGDYILSCYECGNERVREDCDRGGKGWKNFSS